MAGNCTFIHGLEKNAKLIPNAVAISQGNRYLTYKDLDQRANQLGKALLRLGVGRGERVSIALTNSFEFLESTFGAWKLAAITIPLNYRFMDEELIHVLDNSDSVGVILNAEYLEIFQRIWPRLPNIRFLLVVGECEPDPQNNIYQYDTLLKQFSGNKPKLAWKEQGNEDTGYNIYTGGTTGMPKGISYTEKGFTKTVVEALGSNAPDLLQRVADAPDHLLRLLPGGRIISSRLGRAFLRLPLWGKLGAKGAKYAPASYNRFLAKMLAGDVRVLLVSPLMHAWAWAISANLIKLGGTVFLLNSDHYDVEEALGLISKNKIRAIAAIGDSTLKPILAELDTQPDKYSLDTLNVIIASGMPTSPEVKEGLLKRHLNHTILLDVLISSEITHGAATIYTSADTNFNKAVFKVTERIQVLNSDTGEPVSVGEVGEVARQTDVVPQGYYKDPEKTKKLIREFNGKTWLMSGDLAELREDGSFSFVGRGSECINTGGEKVYPEEVENLIRQMDAVEIVGITATPDEKFGEAVTAVIQLKAGSRLTEQQVIEFTKGKISGYKCPRRILFVKEFPTTLIGKPHYKALRELAKQSDEALKSSGVLSLAS